ncbi:NACHT and WD40 domain protein [Penicillium lividum]|nr:NACHT and WD40 domain protein [Penicillium lividum]
MDGLSSAASVIAVIQLTGSLVKVCGGYIQEVKDARDEVIALQRAITGLEWILQDLQLLLQSNDENTLPTSSRLASNITDCLSDLQALEAKIDPGTGKKLMRKVGFRALKWPLKRTELEAVVQNLERHKSSFILSLHVDQTRLIRGITQHVEHFNKMKELDELPFVRGAEYNSYLDQHADRCLPGTRTELLLQIKEWALSPQGNCLFWLSGMAGVGKSTISRTVAHSFKETKHLGASFFFKRGEGDRGNASKLLSTITRQLALMFPGLIVGVRKALHDDPDIASRSLTDQFDKLLLQPLLQLRLLDQKPPTAVIVIDALDECEHDNDIRVITQLLPRFQRASTVRLRIFLTSRPELPIRIEFSRMSHLDYHDVVLHEIPKELTKRDITQFLKHRLSVIRMDRSLPLSWPNDTDFNALVSLSIPLFIFASTVCRILEDPQWDPVERLSDILAHRRDGSQLDRTYLPVLDRLLKDQNQYRGKQLLKEFREVVGTIVMLESPLSVRSLSILTGLSEKLISMRLNSLHSVIHIPKDESMPVRLFHLSFREFLLDPETRDKTPLWLDEKEIHQRLTLQCLSVCDNLKRNICGLPSDGTKRMKIDHKTLSHCLSSELQYSCRFWVQHLAQSKEQELLIHDAFLFLKKHFLHWMEVMSVLGLASEVVGIIDVLQALIVEHASCGISEFLLDAKRFFLKNKQIVDIAPLQIYNSGLVYAPTQAMIRRQFEGELPDWIVRLPSVEETWNTELQTLEGHTGLVRSVVFSPDGRFLATGSYDMTTRLWNTSTGALEQLLEGHSGGIESVAISPNGQLLASGSRDKTIRLWNIATGVLLQTLEDISGSVLSVAFSPDSRLLASGSGDKIIYLWDLDLNTCVLQRTLEGHSDGIESVEFSPDSQLLASGSRDKTVRLWDLDLDTDVPQQTLEGHSDFVWSVSFSPDGRLLASGSRDKTVRLWNRDTGALQQTLEGHSDFVWSVAFSPDSQIVASGSVDKTIKLWNIATGALLQTIEGHSNGVYSVAFLPDGQVLASGSYDMTARLWNPTGDALQKNLEGHSDGVEALAVSPDNRLVASGSRDKTVRLWDFSTGALQQTLEGHLDLVRSVAFSPNGRLLASGSHDTTIRLWNTATGTLERILTGHSDYVRSVAFSHDNRLLASGSVDKTIKLWSIPTGELLQILNGHANGIDSVSFSPDSRILASGSRDTTVRLWDLSKGALQQTLDIFSSWVSAVAFSPDGHLLAIGSRDKTVRLWDCDRGTPQKELKVGGAVTNIEFSEDGLFLNSNLGSLNLQLWRDNHVSSSIPGNGGALISDDRWLMLGDKEILWLPPEYRPICSFVKHSNFIMGHASGRISFIGFNK